MRDLNEKEQELFLAQITKESEPMWITVTMVDHPCKVMLFYFVFLLIFSVLTGTFVYMVPTLEGSRNREYLIWDHPFVVASDKLILAEEYLEETSGASVVDL